jgi:hypothetical protein
VFSRDFKLSIASFRVVGLKKYYNDECNAKVPK